MSVYVFFGKLSQSSIRWTKVIREKPPRAHPEKPKIARNKEPSAQDKGTGGINWGSHLPKTPYLLPTKAPLNKTRRDHTSGLFWDTGRTRSIYNVH